jgi:choline dehydrogenase-like flavoprotein
MRIVVVGSGVSGAHAALTLLERGHDVEVWDVGREDAEFGDPGVTFHDMKDRMVDPVSYFLGADLGALIPPGTAELLRYPPSRKFLVPPDDPLLGLSSDGFFPQGSFSKGGLANGWGANALAFDQNDLSDWPVSASEMDAAYRTVYGRIPVAGPDDDELTPHLQGTYPSQPPVRLSIADERLLEASRRRKRKLRELGVGIGSARLAVVTDPSRVDSCNYCDRCLWGCPMAAIYNPRTSTLVQCEGYRGYSYAAGRVVLSLLSSEMRIVGIRYLDTASREIREEPCDVVFLAAGALQTGAIFLRTLKASRIDEPAKTEGLMDTTVIKVPFVALGGIGQPADARAFQFNRLIMGIVAESPSWPRYLHGELLNLTSLIYYPMIERMPFDSRLSKRVFFAMRSALGALSLFFPDKISSDNHMSLADHGGESETIRLSYRESPEKERFIRKSVSTAQTALRRLGCLPRGAVRSSPGAGIHYAGTVPMGKGARKCNASGRSNLYPNLYIADGAAFPSLPSKSITMSLAAHATRVARIAEL